ncbi:DUF6065 family protein [Lysobacter cavernae]|uniref:DUF6065 family protein n=1 Tax=Lysobacter cavernae TaxID=1685901 RepID=A0ABV7RNQ5_9GAMM
MKLTAYVLDGHTLDIRPAPREREWMDRTDRHYAYRCLPLDIANAHGWELLCPSAFEAVWNGGKEIADLRVFAPAGGPAPAVSHFGHGILTFHIPCLFRTEAGIDLFVTAPLNRPKHGIAGLSGLIEADWAPYTFTMNWQFTRPGHVRFAKDEPYCHFFPVPRQLLETAQPQRRLLSQEPELERQHRKWMHNRGDFLTDLAQPGSAAEQAQWQRAYFRGVDADGACPAGVEHRVKLRLKPFGPLPDE